ncbi:MAG: phosphodiester glycosidase family protein, partial [Polyangiaceae bacterium]
YKLLLHPDASRSWSEVFVVAIDVRRIDLYVVAGSQEPKTDDAKTIYERRARIPDEHHESVLAAFNGGFMTEHGGYGMKVDGVVLVHPKPTACTLALYKDGSLRIASWSKLAEREADMVWYRQAPQCMYEDGKIHPGLTVGSGLKWGATLDGDTVIRRSAVGLSADGQVLYVSITNHTSARALADAMHHAGAVDIAQLDVNWSYPKFVLFEASAPGEKRKAVALASGFEFSEDEYIRKRARRDFFYVDRRPPPK